MGGVSMEYRKGEIYEYLMPKGDTKKAIIVSSNERCCDRFLSVIVLNEEPKGRINVPIVCRSRMYADCGMISYAEYNRFGEYIRTATDVEMQEINEGIAMSLDIETSTEEFVETAVDKEQFEALKAELADTKLKASELKKENELLKEPKVPFFDPEEMIVLKTERDLFKNLYEQTIERLIGA